MRKKSQRKHSRNRRPAFRGGTGTIFCDEAGFTGNNLLDEAQEVFAFASVAIEEDRAKAIVERTIKDFKLQGSELKGSRLLKSENGRRAVTSIFKQCAADARVLVHLKKYAIASKFFEYIFEPALSEQNSIFYGCGFHLYISNLLFAMLRTREASAEMLFEEFSKFVREGSQTALEKIFPRQGLIVDTSADPLACISVFAMMNRAAILDELSWIHGDPSVPNWILDITTTSLFSALSYWGEVYDDLVVFCDRSKPLETENAFWTPMIGRRDHVRVSMFGKERQYTFNLVRLPEFVDSKLHPGVQIADVFASAFASAFQLRYRGKLDRAHDDWVKAALGSMLDDNIWPDLDHMDLRRKSGFVNSLVLHELVERCVKRENFFRGMPEFIATAHRLFARYLREVRP